MQPGFAHPHVTPDGSDGDAGDFGYLFNAEPAEITELYDTALQLVDGRETFESIIKLDKVLGSLRGEDNGLLKRQVLSAFSTLASPVTARVIDQYLPHDACSDPEKMRAVLPFQVRITDKLHVRLVDQRRPLKRVALALLAEIAIGQAA